MTISDEDIYEMIMNKEIDKANKAIHDDYITNVVGKSNTLWWASIPVGVATYLLAGWVAIPVTIGMWFIANGKTFVEAEKYADMRKVHVLQMAMLKTNEDICGFPGLSVMNDIVLGHYKEAGEKIKQHLIDQASEIDESKKMIVDVSQKLIEENSEVKKDESDSYIM